jgi:hypothetical protein
MAEDWDGFLAACDDIETFNMIALPIARERRRADPNDGFAKRLVLEAKRRGYTYYGSPTEGWYSGVPPADVEMVYTELERRQKRDRMKDLQKSSRRTKVPLVSAYWREQDYLDGHVRGYLALWDYRERTGNRLFYEFHDVPEALYKRLFEKDAKETLANIYRMFHEQPELQALGKEDLGLIG